MKKGNHLLQIPVHKDVVVSVLLGFTLLLQPSTILAQTRFKDIIFPTTTTVNVQYGSNVRIAGDTMTLTMDIYQPVGDNLPRRPLMIWIHGGSLTSGFRTEMISFCQDFAKRGYVAATIDYRIGIEDPQGPTTFREALLRGVQDAKAAVRYFRMKAAELRIDTNYIFMGGASAGSFVALHCAFWDQNELPADINQSKWGNLEGTSGNPGYSSQIHSVFSYVGAMVDTLSINAGEPPVACFQGSNDVIVPIDVGIFFQVHTEMYGSRVIGRVATRMGIRNQVVIEDGMGHGTENTQQYTDLINMATNSFYPLVGLINEVDGGQVPNHFALEQNYPNPFNPSTTIKYSIPSSGHVTLQVLDMLGRVVAVLVDTQQPAGTHQATFNAPNLSSGVYFYRLQAGSFSEVKPMALIR